MLGTGRSASTSSIPRTSLIKAVIAEGVSQYGMQTFDQSIMKHYTRGKMRWESAARYCSNPTEFELRVKGSRHLRRELEELRRKEEVV